MTERTQDTRERLEDQYHQIEQQVDQTRAQLQEFNDKAVTFIRENPGWCVIGAVAVGYVVGRMASRRWLA
ncbi:MAG: hypothetical protein H0U74_09575 [Bradymonadaceae bacterium]|nr:hypothetical protein [Lujinxingiaceae bacterium]